ncbi:RusA family crossover junction endodeoxyribonuclease [Streptobacillus canis]|uniref:RusA family crossover junction endodeoxyribonuclease n=1 Tax=Streptobacillus canis TaxID=2678686 RepID=UPI0012E1CAEC|nr:RusA family crossover junction endodeoxyribonuclease [Streptobacillus canis]
MDKIFIKGNVPSSKNSKQWTGNCLISSKTVRKYLKEYEIQWKYKKSDFLKMVGNKQIPLKIHFKFIRDSKRKFDYHNAVQLPCDLMTKHGWIDDDNADNIIPIFDNYEYDKKNPGVEIWVE